MYIPLNNKNFEIGDIAMCLENRFAAVFDHKTGYRRFGNETLTFLTLKNEYKIVEKDTVRKKVKVIADDGVVRIIPYYRLGVPE